MKLSDVFIFFKEYRELKRQKGENSEFVFGKFFPISEDRNSDAGSMSGHYFHQDLFVARKIYQNKPRIHVDIGSMVNGFIAHLAVFREVVLFDIRPLESQVANIRFRQADLLNLPEGMVDYCDSISSLHAIEHFGLGRYGDPIDYFGHKKALDNIYKILKKKGKFYFSVPIGRQRIEFNAHRIFSVLYLIDLFKDKYKIDSFCYVDDAGDFHENIDYENVDLSHNFGCDNGCGIFEMTKL